MAACVEEGRRRWLPALAAAAVFAWIAGKGVWAPSPPPYHQSPASAFNSVLDFHAGRVGLSGRGAGTLGRSRACPRSGGGAAGVPAASPAAGARGGIARLRGCGDAVRLPLDGGDAARSARQTTWDLRYRPAWIDEALPGDARVALLPELPIEMPPWRPEREQLGDDDAVVGHRVLEQAGRGRLCPRERPEGRPVPVSAAAPAHRPAERPDRGRGAVRVSAGAVRGAGHPARRHAPGRAGS